MSDIRISNVVIDSVVDGPGLRFTVFVQGCPHRCPGCHNPCTWKHDGGELVSASSLIQKFDEYPFLDGITLSGGEPLDQAAGLIPIAKHAKSKGKHVMCYTGYTWEQVVRGSFQKPELLELMQYVDICIDGRFMIQERSLALKYRGSRNQRVINVAETMRLKKLILYEFEDIEDEAPDDPFSALQKKTRN